MDLVIDTDDFLKKIKLFLLLKKKKKLFLIMFISNLYYSVNVVKNFKFPVIEIRLTDPDLETDCSRTLEFKCRDKTKMKTGAESHIRCLLSNVTLLA